jgi:serine/threonine-protein kinase HipA
MNRCLICGKKYSGGTYHPKCSHTLFGSPTPPVIEYTWQELNSLAEKIIRNRITVTGVQPKLSLHIEKNRANSSRLTIVGFEGGYILKPPTTHFPLMPEAEHFCMTLARHCKIKTAEFGLIKLKSGEKAYITKRMDRTPDGPLHMEDFCQLTNRLTEDKYRSSMEQVGKALRRFSSIPGLDVISLFEIAVFSFLTGNSDMHLKNFSLFRLNNGTCRLTPAYDLLPVKILMPEDSEELALTLNGKKKRLTRNDFLIFGERLKMTEKQIENALNRIVSGVLDNLPTTMKNSFLPDDLHKQIANLAQNRSAILVN